MMKTLNKAIVLALSCLLATTACSQPSGATDSKTTQNSSKDAQIRTLLTNAGLTTPIRRIAASDIAGLHEIFLANGERLLISDDLRYLIQGEVLPNPSPSAPIDEKFYKNQTLGSKVSADYKAALQANMSEVEALGDSDFYYTGIPSLLWGAASDGSAFFISSDSKFFIDASHMGVIENGRYIGEDSAFYHAKNRQILSQLPDALLAVYPAKNERGVLYVATDINCPYCRQFHTQISDLNAKGITVKAIGYPIFDRSIAPMRKLWCATGKKRADLLNAAMKGVLESPKTCQSTLDQQQKLAHPLGIHATPAIFNAKGELFSGDFRKAELVDFAKRR